MFAYPKVWLSLGGLMAALVVINVIVWMNAAPTPRAITISLAGYTNLPGDRVRFALFIVSNQAPYAIRWRGDWVEVRGNPNNRAPIVNSKLPGHGGSGPVLGAGHAFTMAVGVPGDLAATGRWRFAAAYVQETVKQWWLDRSFREGWPTKVGPFLLVDDQEMFNSSNYIKATSQWLGK
jgi:hypothetical protein